MANDPIGTPRRPISSPGNGSQPPEWLVTMMRICTAVYPLVCGVTALACILLLAMIATKHTDFAWLARVNSAFGFLTGLGVLCLLIACYEQVVIAAVVLLLGIALNYAPTGLALLCKQCGQNAQLPLVQDVGATAQGVGTFTEILAVISLIVWGMLYFLRREEREHAARIGAFQDDVAPKSLSKPSLIPKCWEMSRCRPSVRKHCPNFVGRTSCWKRRGGCLCDQSVANQMISSSGRGEAHEVIEMQQKANLRRGVVKTTPGVRPSWSEQKHMCYSCPLFTEHQEYKYRYFNWLCLPITAAIVMLIFHVYDSGYSIVAQQIGKMLNNNVAVVQPAVPSHSPFEWVVLGILSLLLWTVMVSMMDRIFIKWKL